MAADGRGGTRKVRVRVRVRIRVDPHGQGCALGDPGSLRLRLCLSTPSFPLPETTPLPPLPWMTPPPRNSPRRRNANVTSSRVRYARCTGGRPTPLSPGRRLTACSRPVKLAGRGRRNATRRHRVASARSWALTASTRMRARSGVSFCPAASRYPC